MDCSLPGSPGQWILQEKILEWAAIPFSRGSSRCRDQIWVSFISCTDWQVDSLLLSHQGSLKAFLPRVNSPALEKRKKEKQLLWFRKSVLCLKGKTCVRYIIACVSNSQMFYREALCKLGKTNKYCIQNKLYFTLMLINEGKIFLNYLCDPTDYSQPGSSVHGIL